MKGASSLSGRSSIGRVDYVQNVTLDRHSAAARIRKLRMDTWNVLTMLQKGKLKNLKQEMDRMNLNTRRLSEKSVCAPTGHCRPDSVIEKPAVGTGLTCCTCLCVGVNLPDTEVCRGATPWSWSESSTEETVVVLLLPCRSCRVVWSSYRRRWININP
ncbi:hypothetical protein PoB_003534500 [Plakobranchus ocellatus]|uniref:Uncharacterized protein n=1 Tax=Plakobranchus ocellatus TaxID=259542 RepID=A0AAV4ANC0_9GAST|nr:hypothetical protein PoB_003534500 [Plakobranchus ocellatus]